VHTFNIIYSFKNRSEIIVNIVSTLIEAHVFRKVKDDLEFLLLRRSSKEIYPNIWQMVTGSSHEKEKGFETALREIKEETGLIPQKFWIVPKVNSFYNSAKDEIVIVPVFSALVDNESEVHISDEHSEYIWLNKIDAVQLLAWPGQRESLEIIYNYFMSEQCFLTLTEIQL
jgi:dihydroneopterin triphosphate diphosphatase